jgi:hypothetical protein
MLLGQSRAHLPAPRGVVKKNLRSYLNPWNGGFADGLYLRGLEAPVGASEIKESTRQAEVEDDGILFIEKNLPAIGKSVFAPFLVAFPLR